MYDCEGTATGTVTDAATGAATDAAFAIGASDAAFATDASVAGPRGHTFSVSEFSFARICEIRVEAARDACLSERRKCVEEADAEEGDEADEAEPAPLRVLLEEAWLPAIGARLGGADRDGLNATHDT